MCLFPVQLAVPLTSNSFSENLENLKTAHTVTYVGMASLFGKILDCRLEKNCWHTNTLCEACGFLFVCLFVCFFELKRLCIGKFST